MKKSTSVVIVFLILVSSVHLLRLVLKWKVTVNTIDIPLWASAAACIVTAMLAAWLWNERK
jgi:hypothetical protein